MLDGDGVPELLAQTPIDRCRLVDSLVKQENLRVVAFECFTGEPNRNSLTLLRAEQKIFALGGCPEP